MVGPPPSPFAPLTESWDADSRLYRVYRNNHRAAQFNLGEGKPTRFAFFSDPRMPVLYAAQSEQAAVAETILHDVPLRAGHCDGIVWLSRHRNTARSVVLFGDRVAERELSVDTGFARAFINPTDLEWLAALCEQVGVHFSPPNAAAPS